MTRWVVRVCEAVWRVSCSDVLVSVVVCVGVHGGYRWVFICFVSGVLVIMISVVFMECKLGSVCL